MFADGGIATDGQALGIGVVAVEVVVLVLLGPGTEGLDPQVVIGNRITGGQAAVAGLARLHHAVDTAQSVADGIAGAAGDGGQGRADCVGNLLLVAQAHEVAGQFAARLAGDDLVQHLGGAHRRGVAQAGDNVLNQAIAITGVRCCADGQVNGIAILDRTEVEQQGVVADSEGAVAAQAGGAEHVLAGWQH